VRGRDLSHIRATPALNELMARSSLPDAASAASLRDDLPRVVRQAASVFLVSRSGELWRVFDSAASSPADGPGSLMNPERRIPSSASRLPVRLFVALARKTDVRVHSFPQGASRSIDAAELQRQLERAHSH
jgi:hypothetical protein